MDIAETIEHRFGLNYPVIDALRILATEQTHTYRSAQAARADAALTQLAALCHTVNTELGNPR